MGRPIPLLVKLSAAGVPEWSVLLGRTEEQVITSLMDLAQTEDGGAVLVGRLVQAPTFKVGEPAVVKVDSRGQPVWSHRLPLAAPGMAQAVAVLPGGDLVVAGAVERPDGPDDPPLGMFLMRAAPDGTPRWARKVSMAGHAMAPTNVAATGEGFVVLGDMGGGGALDLVALSFTGRGTLAWSRRYTDPETRNAHALALAVEETGELVFAGSTGAVKGPKSGAVLVAGPDGALRLSSALGGGQDHGAWVTSVQPLGAGRLCVALTTEGAGRSAGILTATWTLPTQATASRFQATLLEVRVSELELRAEPLRYANIPLPADGLIERALPPHPP